mmetsp:Transcript_10643/g.22883  ORF Transcript_10643/g.22883 Transcript_10643/m.22883 type:complete len:136 (-) Transcript_10643:561-968(-)
MASRPADQYTSSNSKTNPMSNAEAKNIPSAPCSVAKSTEMCPNSQGNRFQTPRVKARSCAICQKQYSGANKRTELLLRPKREGEYTFPIYKCRDCLGDAAKGRSHQISSAARDIWNLAMHEDETKIIETYSKCKN